jgi:hypothetical protein
MYFDVMVCAPEVTVEVVNFTAPPLKDAVFRLPCHRRKVTVAVAVPPNCGVAVALNVTECPKFDGFSEEARRSWSRLYFTTCFTGFDVLPPNVLSPPYTAVILATPTGSADVLKTAEPPLRVPVPSIAP